MKKILVINTASSSIGNGIFSIAYSYVKLSHDLYQYDFVFAGRKTEEAKELLSILGVNVIYPKYSRLKQPLRYKKWLTNFIKNNAYDIVHVHGNSATMYIEINSSRIAGVKKRIAHCHSTSCKFVFLHKLLVNSLNKELTDAVACSYEAGLWIFDDQFTILHNGIDSKSFCFNEKSRNTIRSEMGLSNKFIIGQVGYLSKEKNQLFSLNLLHKLCALNFDVVLLLLGEGAYYDCLLEKANELDVQDRVLFLGKKKNIYDYYSSMDVFLLPSLFEGFGLSIIEAQANGLPCIASNNVPKATKMNEHTEYLNLEDERSWIERIDKVYKSSLDRNEESIKCINVIKENGFDIHDCIHQLIDLYGE